MIHHQTGRCFTPSCGEVSLELFCWCPWSCWSISSCDWSLGSVRRGFLPWAWWCGPQTHS